MTLWLNIVSYFHKYFSIPSINAIDIIEMILIAVLFYYLMIWLKRTSAWTLVKGILTILVVLLLASIFNFSTIVWIISNTINVGIIALIIIFQPELRHALEQLGQRIFFKNVANIRNSGMRFSEETRDEILKAVAEMSRSKTGALISIEENVALDEYVRTGIALGANVSSQLLLNIFVDKTPLHDGAVIIRNNSILAATCYFPLSASRMLNKKFGTRHRAALGVSEVSDAFTIVVSEETGAISVAVSGMLIESVDIDELKNRLSSVQNDQPSFSWFDRFRKEGKKIEAEADTEEVHNQ